jgi:Tfp pilus assembly protein PilO
MQVDKPISIVIIGLIIVLSVSFFVYPEYKTFNRLRLELGEKKAEFNAEFDYYADITKTYYELKNREELLEKIDNALPNELAFGRIVYFFQKTAEENGLMVRDLFLSKSSRSDVSGVSGKINEIVFSIDLMGDYSSLKDFIIALEDSARIFEVISISFGSESFSQLDSLDREFEVYQTYLFNLQIKTYSY